MCILRLLKHSLEEQIKLNGFILENGSTMGLTMQQAAEIYMIVGDIPQQQYILYFSILDYHVP